MKQTVDRFVKMIKLLLTSQEPSFSSIRWSAIILGLCVTSSWFYSYVAGALLAFAAGVVVTIAQAINLYAGREIAEKEGPYQRALLGNILGEYDEVKRALTGKAEHKQLLNRITLCHKLHSLMLAIFLAYVFLGFFLFR